MHCGPFCGKLGARKAQLLVGQPKGCQVELRAVLEHLHAIDEAAQ